MAQIVCIGRDSAISDHVVQLRSLGHRLDVVGSVEEYLRVAGKNGPDVALVAESFDPESRKSVAFWVRKATASTRVIFLYLHHIADTRHADGIANIADFENVVDALDFVLLDRRAAAAAG